MFPAMTHLTTNSPSSSPIMSLDNDAVPAIPNLALAQCVFVLQQPSLAHIHDSTRKTLIEAINRDGELISCGLFTILT